MPEGTYATAANDKGVNHTFDDSVDTSKVESVKSSLLDNNNNGGQAVVIVKSKKDLLDAIDTLVD